MANFEKALAFVLRNEDPHLSGIVTEDAGGFTRFGVARRFHPELADEFYTGQPEAALEVARKIYREQYWRSMKGEEIRDQSVANKLLDMAVNMGVRQAVALCQRALNVVSNPPLLEDGVCGSRTLHVINSADPGILLGQLRDLCCGFYRHVAAVRPEMERYLHGWLRRAKG